jgi:hypothetical protein
MTLRISFVEGFSDTESSFAWLSRDLLSISLDFYQHQMIFTARSNTVMLTVAPPSTGRDPEVVFLWVSITIEMFVVEKRGQSSSNLGNSGVQQATSRWQALTHYIRGNCVGRRRLSCFSLTSNATGDLLWGNGCWEYWKECKASVQWIAVKEWIELWQSNIFSPTQAGDEHIFPYLHLKIINKLI